MKIKTAQQLLLKSLPGIDHLLDLAQEDPIFSDVPKALLLTLIRNVVSERREEIVKGSVDMPGQDVSDADFLEIVKRKAKKRLATNLIPVINATGVVVHTNLGRSPLPSSAIEQLISVASGYSNLEYNVTKGVRGSRYSHVEDILSEISGAESAMVVNNNAGAVLLALETLAREKNVLVSRGELVEIGGSFRIPDIMAKSGGILTEIGSTNRTHLRDYENAIGHNTGLILKVHQSNYSMVGFTASVGLKDLVALGTTYHIPVMEDLGSGTFIDFSKYGLIQEPTIQASVATGVDVVTFSGDKLLGGPQAGVILGKKPIIDRIKKNPLTRALRIDKLTLAALEATLSIYRDEETAVRTIPTLQMLTQSYKKVEQKAKRLLKLLKSLKEPRLDVGFVDLPSRVGGGAMPSVNLSSKCIGVQVENMSVNAIEQFLRKYTPPIIGRIENNIFIIDPRTIWEKEFGIIKEAFKEMTRRNGT
jgi:L-seryl-tRNA(Ser) seleniumtransferase